MVSVYGDESADQTKQRSFAVAGVIATEEEWSRVEELWLDRTRGTVFHATDCDSNHGAFAGNDHNANKALYRDLVQFLVHSDVYGFGAAVDLAQFRGAYPEVPVDLAYYKAFWETVTKLSWFAHRHFKDSVKFTFDNRVESNYNAANIYRVLITESMTIPDAPKLADDISFSSAKMPRIQMGDLYAREVMKYLDHQIGPVYRKRGSMEALIETKRFGADLFTDNYFHDMREKTAQLELDDPQFNRHTYTEWLGKTKQSDTMTNRFKFLAFVSAEDAKKQNCR